MTRLKPLTNPLTTICLLVVSIIFHGCSRQQSAQESNESDSNGSKSDSSKASIAVIDLDLVAKELGASQTLDKLVAEREKELDELVMLNREAFRQEYLKLQQKFGDTPSSDQLLQLSDLQDKHNQSIVQQIKESRIKLINYRNQVSIKFMEEVKPIAYEKAQARGLTIVLSKGQFFIADSQIDITKDVIDEIKQINAKANAVSLPPLPTNDRTARIPDGGTFSPMR